MSGGDWDRMRLVVVLGCMDGQSGMSVVVEKMLYEGAKREAKDKSVTGSGIDGIGDQG